MPKDDLVYVGHMLDTARRAAAKIEGRTRTDYDADENLRLALAHLIQTIGEAARRISREFREQHPDLPWRDVISMRHKVVHDYVSVDYDIVWGVVSVELPALISSLTPLVPPSTEKP